MNNRAAQPHALVIGAMAIAAVFVTTVPDRADTASATDTTAPTITLASSSLSPHAVTGGS